MGSAPLRSPRRADGRFVNWAGTVTSTPTAWHAPASDDALASLVRQTSLSGGRVRVVGAGHSWSSIAAPQGVAVSLDALTGVLALDRAQSLVTVRGGTRLYQLNQALDAQGFALPIVGSVAQQSVAGAIATGTHGSSLVHGNLSSLVESLTLVTADGESFTLNAGDPRLEGARVHLGALGVVTRVTLRVVPAFHLAETVDNIPVAEAVRSLEAIARSAEYVKLWWLPHTPMVQVFRCARTDAPTSRWPGPAVQRWVDDALLQRHLFPAVVALGRWRTRWIPPVNRLLARVYLDRPRRVGPSALMLSTPMPFVHRETEAAMPLARAGEALERIVKVVDRTRVRVNFPVEARFVRGDAAWLSPAQGGDACQLGAYMAEAPGIERYFAAFWAEMRPLEARPHWGKELAHTADELRALYPCFEQFLALREALDPGRLFANPFLERALGA